MPGTLLVDDWRKSVEDRLNEHITNLQRTTQQALQTVTQPVQQAVADPGAVAARLQAHVESLTQPAVQPLGDVAQQAQQVVQPIGDVGGRLQAHVENLLGATPQAVQPLQAPAPPPQQQPAVQAPQHEPSPPIQTLGTQIANTSNASGQVFPLAVKPDNTPTATYHSQGGSDLMAPRGTPVLNMQGGTVTDVYTDNGSHTVGGNAVLIHGDDGLDYYYAHFDQPTSLKAGQRVGAGEQIGAVGNSGNAYKGGQGETHLHIGIGHGISNGVGSEGGLGQNFNAQELLTNLQSGIGQATTAARGAVETASRAVQTRLGQGQQEFVGSLQPLAQQVADRTGVDPNVMLAIAANETGWGRSQTAQQQNNLFSIQGDGRNGSRWATYDSPAQAFDAFVNLISSAPRYAQAWADRADPVRFVDDLRNAGYVADEPGFPAQGWVDQVKSIYRGLPQAAVGPSPQRTAAAGALPPSSEPGVIDVARPAVKPVLYGTTSQPETVFGEAGRRPAREVVPETLGAAAAGFGQGISSALGLNRTEDERRASADKYQADVMAAVQERQRQAAEPMTLGKLAQGTWSLIINDNPSTGVTWGDYQRQQELKNQWIEANNPTKELTRNNVPLVEGLTTLVAQQLTDPLVVLSFGPTGALGRSVGGAVGERVMDATSKKFLAAVAEKLSSGAITNGIQQALFEAEKPGADALTVGEGFLTGGLFGGVLEAVPTTARRAIATKVGQAILDRASEARPAVQRFLHDEEGALKVPPGRAPQDVLHGQAVPRPGYKPGTPEHTTETFLQDRARAQGTARPMLSGADVAGLPGMQGSRSRGLDDVRDAVDAGMPAARWYQEIVKQIQADTGQDINPREGAVLMGAFGGNAGVAPNYHAMLSIFDAMRQAHPDLTGLEHMSVPQIMDSAAFKAVDALVSADKAYADKSMLARVMRGYRTGEIPVPSGAKLSSYTQDFLHALNEQYSPYSTQDVWQGRLFGARPDIGVEDFVAKRDDAYRTMHALTNWIARERNLPPDQAQAAAWTVFRGLWNDPTIGPELRADRIGLSDAIRQGQQSGLLNPQALASGGLAEVTGPRSGVPTAWVDKINDVRDRIRRNGSYNAPPPETGTALERMALYHPSQQGRAGSAVGTRVGGIARPVGNEQAAALRELAIGDQPVLRVPGDVQVDPATGRIPWLMPEHTVQRAGDHTYVMVTGVGDDAAHLIGLRLGADRFNHADPTSTNHGGLNVDGLASREEQARLADALQAAGLPVIRETVGTGLRVPLVDGKIGGLGRQLRQILDAEGLSGTLTTYTGDTHAVQSTGSGRTRSAGNQAGAAGPLGVPAGNGVPGQRLAATVFRDAATGGGSGFTAPRERAEASVLNLERFHPELHAIARGEGPLYHGGNAAELASGRPTFLTSDREGAAWYARERGTGGTVREVQPSFTNPATIDELQDAASAAGATLKDIPDHSPYGGDNPLDLTYIPSVRAELERRGFDAVVAHDALENGEIPVAVVWGKIRNALSGRQPAQSSVPYGLSLGGAALGGVTGNAATPEDAPLDVRLRNIGLGATAGLLGGHIAGRGLGGRLTPELARAGEGFRAPERGGPRPGDSLLRTTTRDRPETRGLGGVHSNPHLLDEAGPDEPALTADQLGEHFDRLNQTYEANTERLAAIDEQLRNPSQKPVRPPWAAGYTNTDLIEIARRHDVSPYQEAWWDTVNLKSGSGELRENVGQSGLRGTSRRESTPAELRAEAARLTTEQQDLVAASDQLGNAPRGVRFAQRTERAAAVPELPFDAGSDEAAPHGPYATEGSGPSGVLAADIVTRNGTSKRPSGLKSLWNDASQVVGTTKGVTGRGVTDASGATPPSEATLRAMPNLDALLSKEVPDEVRLQIQRAVEDNPDLFAAYQQGRISHDSLRDDLARKVGMTTKDWLATPVGQGFSTPELVALQAAAVDMQHSTYDMAHEILARGGVDSLTPEEVAFGLSNLFDAARLASVASGARSTQGRGLNALKIRMDRALSRGITGANEAQVKARLWAEAKRGEARAAKLLETVKETDAERSAVQARLTGDAAPKSSSIWQKIDDAYNDLDRYTAMSLHEKADDFAAQEAARAERAAARKAAIANREPAEALLSALNDELAAERKIFAGRKNTWEEMAFWDSKQFENDATKRADFRGGLALEQAKKSAANAARNADQNAARDWAARSRTAAKDMDRAKTLLENMGGVEPSKELLRAFTEAVASKDPMVAAKFLKGLQPKRSGFAGIVEMARNANIMRVAGMLSATATHVVNMGGNTIMIPLELGTHALAAGIDMGVTAVTKGERQAYFAELGPMASGWLRTGADADGKRLGMLAALPDALKILQTGIGPAEVADLSKIRPGFRSGIPGAAGETVDTAVEMPLRALQAEDALFRGGAFGMHASRVAIREATRMGMRGQARTNYANKIIANLEDHPELYQEAAEAAARMIFQERRTAPMLGGIKPKGTAGEALDIGASQVMPFKKTPINITAQGMGLSPLGILGVGEAIGSRGALRARIATGEIPASRLGKQRLLAEERAARAVIGSAILGAAYLYGTATNDDGTPQGNLTAMYDEDEASTYPPGWRAWSFRTKNAANGEVVYTPFQTFGAAGTPLAMAAIMADAQRRGKTFLTDDKEIGRALSGVGRYALDTPFLQGLSDVVDLMHDPGRAGTKFVEGLVGSYGPYSGMGRQVQRAFGVASRNPREGWGMLLDSLEADYPGLSGNVPEATDPLGQPRVPGATGLGALVGRYDIERENPTLKMLRENDVGIPPAPKAINIGRGESIELTEAEQDQVKRGRGAAIQQAVTDVQQSRAWQGADVTQRNAMLKQAVNYGTQTANLDFYQTLSPSDIQRRAKPKAVPEPYYIGSAP